MIHVLPAYLKEPITQRAHCFVCQTQRLFRCQAVGAKQGDSQQVETICLHCGKRTTK